MAHVRTDQTGAERTQRTSENSPALPHTRLDHAGIQRAIHAPVALTSTDVLTLQRQVGNQAVQRILGRTSAAPTVQRALTVGPADDRYEREADAIARTVTSAPSVNRAVEEEAGQPTVQRTIGAEGGVVSADLESRLRRSQGTGSSLPGSVRRAIEPKLGADLRGIKVHTDRTAVQLAREMGAKAFTHKNHIYYSAGQSPSNLKLTAHEAVHTIQQGAVRQNPVQRTRSFVRKQDAASGIQRWPWSRKKDKRQEEKPQPNNATGSPYSALVSKFMPGADTPIDRPLLAKAQGYAGSISAATPDYTNPALAGQEPDQYTVTLAVAQEEDNWWEEIRAVKRMAIKKAFQSPRKLISKIKSGEAEQYLLTKIVKQRKGLAADADVAADDVEKLEDVFHSVGHVWVRLTTWVGGQVKDLYSYGFWPLKTPDEGGYEMNKYVPGQVRHPDTEHEGDALKRYYDKTVTRKQFNKALALAQERYTNPPTYHLLDYNCTKFGKEIMEAAGRSYSGKGVLPSIGFSPGQLYAAIGKRKDKNRKGKKAYEKDPLENIVKQIDLAKEGRSRNFDPDALGGSADLSSASDTEVAKLIGLDPADYPPGTYIVKLNANLNLPAATDPNGDYSTNVEFWPSDGDIKVFVEDDLTSSTGRAKVIFFSQIYYVPIDKILQPGLTPDEPAVNATTHSHSDSTASDSTASDSTASDSTGTGTRQSSQPSATAASSGHPPFIEEIKLTSHMGVWDENFKDLGGSIRPGEVIGITGRQRNGYNEYYYDGKAYYIDDAWWDMYFGRPYPKVETTHQPTGQTSSPSVSLGPQENDQSRVSITTQVRTDTEIKLPHNLINPEAVHLFKMDEWESGINFGWYDKSDITSLTQQQLEAFANLVGFTPEHILEKMDELS